MFGSLSRPQGRLTAALFLLSARSRDFGGEIGFLLLDSLAQRVVHEARDLNGCSDLALGFLDGLSDRLGVVMDERLFEQTDLLVVRLQAGLDDLLDHVLRLALLTIFVGEHVLLALDQRWIETG